MDPLSVLREFYIRKQLDKVTYDGDDLVFGDEARFQRDVETAYKNRKTTDGKKYTLEALFFFAQQNSYGESFGRYTQLAVQNKIPNVTYLDRTGLLEYLEGKVTTNDRIDPIAMVIPPTRAAAPASAKQREEEDKDADWGEDAGPLAKKARGEEQAPGLREELEFKSLMERERPVRDRDHLLLCHRKSFESILKKLSSSTDMRQPDGRTGEGGPRGKETKATAAPVEALPPPPGVAGRYAEVGQKQYWKGYLQSDAAEELKIDQYGGTGPKAQPQSQAQKASGAPGPPRSMPRPQSHHHRPSSHAGKSSSEQQTKQQDVPIILVPQAVKTPLNTYNAKEFLEDGKYIFPEEKMQSLPGKPSLVMVNRVIGRTKKVQYSVRDKLPPNSPEWDRVVAVFVLGKEWQFKDWPGKTPAEILHKYKGVYIHFHNESVDALKTIKSWNVQILTLHKTQRHKDLQVAREFWESLDTFLNARKSTLVY